MAYPHLHQIADIPTRNAIKQLWDAIHTMREDGKEIGTVVGALTESLDSGRNRIVNVADAKLELDAVNLRTLRNYVTMALATAEQTTSHGTPSGDPTGLTGSCASPPPNGDIGTGAPTFERALEVVCGTAEEWIALRVATDEATRATNQAELLMRIIWHLNQAGFTAGRQRNPNGNISGDKITITLDDAVLHAFDVFQGVEPSEVLPVAMNEVFPASYVAEAGTAD